MWSITVGFTVKPFMYGGFCFMLKKVTCITFMLILMILVTGCSNGEKDEEFVITPEQGNCSENEANEIADKVYDAAVEGNFSGVQSLLKSEENIPIDNCKAAQEEAGIPYILHVVFPHHMEISKLLIDYGADLNTIGVQGDSYLHDAVIFSEDITSDELADLTEYILKKGADPNIKGSKDFNMTPVDYLMTKSPLLAHNFSKMYKLLTEYGADITEKTLKTSMDSDSGFTYAPDICAYLKANNIDTDICKVLEAMLLGKSEKEIIQLIKSKEYTRHDKKYIVWYASAMCSPDVLKCLKNERFNLKIKNGYGMSILDIAAGYNDSETVEYLIEQGFDVNGGINSKSQNDESKAFEQSADLKKYTPLSFALANGKTKNAEVLLKAGAEFQRNSWLIAVFADSIKGVDILIDNDFKQEDIFIFYCYAYGSDYIVKYLLNKGVSYDVCDYGETLLEFLRGYNDDRADLIMKYSAEETI